MRTIVITVLLFVAVIAGAQGPPQFPPLTERVPLKSYVDDTLAFELSYPVTYHQTQPPSVIPVRNAEWVQVLFYAVTGVGEKRGSIRVMLDRRRFDLKTIGENYEHMGWTDAVSFQIAGRTFYYIGAGGGGVDYPDTFFHNLDGRILVIEFDGPYQRGKSPTEATKAIEKLVLESFRVRGRSSPGQ